MTSLGIIEERLKPPLKPIEPSQNSIVGFEEEMAPMMPRHASLSEVFFFTVIFFLFFLTSDYSFQFTKLERWPWDYSARLTKLDFRFFLLNWMMIFSSIHENFPIDYLDKKEFRLFPKQKENWQHDLKPINLKGKDFFFYWVWVIFSLCKLRKIFPGKKKLSNHDNSTQCNW